MATPAQLAALESAIYLGVLSVEYPDGTKKTYRSLEEMQQIRKQLRQALGLTKKDQGRRFAQHSKGV